MISYKSQIEEICYIAEKLKNEKAINLSKFLKQRINNPDRFVAFLGESCSGKSTLINRLIGEKILVESGVPSTASVTEVYLNSEKEKGYFAIYKNATMAELNYDEFKDMSLEPEKDIERLRCCLYSDDDWSGIRIFDTPGYGSMVENHESVLFEFLPNCDAIVYTVSYRIGIQEADYEFLELMNELTRAGIPFSLVINRCPENVNKDDRRIREIVEYVQGIVGIRELPVSLVRGFNELTAEEIKKDIASIKDFIISNVKSEEREAELNEAFRNYLLELCDIIVLDIDRQTSLSEMDQTERQLVLDSLKQYMESFEKAKGNIIIPEFNRLINAFPKQVDQSMERIKKNAYDEIEKQSMFSKEETGVFIKQHILRFYGQKETSELQFYVGNEIEAIDKQVNDYLNNAFVKIENDIKIKNMSETGRAGMGIVHTYGAKMLNSGLTKYFAQFGGRGGAGAGMANAASHTLKKFGEMFGKTFSRDTHNAVKHIMKKIGLTSTKTLAAAATVFIDVAIEAIDLATWKPILKNATSKALKKWSKDVKQMITKDLEELKNKNISNFDEFIAEAKKDYSVESNYQFDDIQWMKAEKARIEEIKRSIA